MQKSHQEIKLELKNKTESIQKKVHDVFGDYVRDIDFSSIPLFSVLYNQILKHDPKNPASVHRDRLVVSSLKVLPSLLAVLADSEYINWKECREMILQIPKLFSSPNIALVNYPGTDLITQNLYFGMTDAIGEALIGSQIRSKYRVYHILNEKRSTRLQTILTSASLSKLSNITAIIPYIDMQKRPSAIHFWFSMGWQLEEVRFDDTSLIYGGLNRALQGKEKPQVLI